MFALFQPSVAVGGQMVTRPRFGALAAKGAAVLAALAGLSLVSAGELRGQMCATTVKASVVALDQIFFWNRLGAFHPQGMIYALRRDIVHLDGTREGGASGYFRPGQVMLREDKRPRPLVLRVNVGDCLEIEFQNLLAPSPRDQEQPATRTASIHAIGMQLMPTGSSAGIRSDGSNVGTNPNSLVEPGDWATYTLYAEREGGHLCYSAAATTGGEGDGGSIPPGLFCAIIVEPRGSEWYRSQVTRMEMDLATAGYTPAYQPILDYDAVYPVGHRFEGLPILKMTDASGEIVHSDLTAVITGPNRGWIGGVSSKTACQRYVYPANPILETSDQPGIERSRCEPFREFVVLFHDEIGAVQAFPEFEDPVLGHTLHSVRDGFAINYGTAAIGAEVLANRFGVGPMANCNECKYEEFFLSSWTVGDPAMVVDVPANADLDVRNEEDPGTLRRGAKATVALYPDDPSNVYHSYLSDHVKIRNIHAGPKEHHIFHLHAHQWVGTPDDHRSTYLDSQGIGPGSAYTYEATYNGGGNRPKTPGDAIFHCHFYPHFAQGMWALWRVHDVFEQGTKMANPLNPLSPPAPYARVLPDGEIAAGTPIPGLVPLPGRPMAPMPTADFPGFPLYIPGVAGHRAPKAPDQTVHDGGLPRHVVTGGVAHFPPVNRLSFAKDNVTLQAKALPEAGDDLELKAKNFHAGLKPDGTWSGATRGHPTFVQPLNGSLTPLAATFRVNGQAAVAGAPFADPCVDDFGNQAGVDITYKAAAFQIDAKYTKSGWHFPQHRMLGLVGDVPAFRSGAKAPEPLFFRANTNHCINFQLTNLLPNVYELDDFQVHTPTDVIGQHIHLVKFDVTASDGATNGFNYESGALSPDEVIERINALKAPGGGWTPVGSMTPLTGSAVPLNPTFNPAVPGDPHALGAQTIAERWFADDVLDSARVDRTLRTVYTHDHFSPSTQQQTGYYAGLSILPEGARWRDPETGAIMGGPAGGTRPDGGPTSWRADILSPYERRWPSFREFMIEFQDMQLAYFANSDNSRKLFDAGNGLYVHGIADPEKAINPPGRVEIGLPFLLARPDRCPGGVQPPCPEAISADDPGMMTVNYRAEPLAMRVRDPSTNMQAPGLFGDLSHVFRSIPRADPDFNLPPSLWPYGVNTMTSGAQQYDAFTPTMRVYEGDRVQIRILVGAHEEGHNFSVHGAKWLFEGSMKNSGWRNSQGMGISEHFEFELAPRPPVEGLTGFDDYLYKPGSSTDDLWNGTWGIMRAYHEPRSDLYTLPNNPQGTSGRFANPRDFKGVCPVSAPERRFSIVAITAQDALGGPLVYNDRTSHGGRLHDPTAILYVHEADLEGGRLKAGVPVEPLILRANAGDCIRIEVANRLPPSLPDYWDGGMLHPDLPGFSTLPMVVDNFNNNQIKPSSDVGIHTQLLAYTMSESDGYNVGFNPVQTAPPGGKVEYKWYAGRILICTGSTDPEVPECNGKRRGWRVARPVEFGVVNLMPTDAIKHASKGLIGALVVMPRYATWAEDAHSRAAATVWRRKADGEWTGEVFRDFVLLFQDDVNLRQGSGYGSAVPNLADSDDPEDSGQKGFNYRTEPLWKRLGFDPDDPLEHTRTLDFTDALTNAKVGGDPKTPVFTAQAGTPVIFRVAQPGGHQRNHAFILHGHEWQQLPFTDNSSKIGENRSSGCKYGWGDMKGCWLSEFYGAQAFIGPTSHFNFPLQNGAGGKARVTGDFLVRDFASFQFDGGLWALLRVLPYSGGYPPSAEPPAPPPGGKKKK